MGEFLTDGVAVLDYHFEVGVIDTKENQPISAFVDGSRSAFHLIPEREVDEAFLVEARSYVGLSGWTPILFRTPMINHDFEIRSRQSA